MYFPEWIKDHPKVERAFYFAVAAHEATGQVRKYEGGPYYVHPVRVAEVIAEIPGHQFGGVHSVCAALLHDVVEDTAVTIEHVREMFGDEVAALVAEVTNPSKLPEHATKNRAARKEIDLEHLKGASPRGATIKMADILDNHSSIIEHDPHFAKTWVPEARRIIDAIGLIGEPILYSHVASCLSTFTASTQRTRDERP